MYHKTKKTSPVKYKQTKHTVTLRSLHYHIALTLCQRKTKWVLLYCQCIFTQWREVVTVWENPQTLCWNQACDQELPHRWIRGQQYTCLLQGTWSEDGCWADTEAKQYKCLLQGTWSEDGCWADTEAKQYKCLLQGTWSDIDGCWADTEAKQYTCLVHGTWSCIAMLDNNSFNRASGYICTWHKRHKSPQHL